MEKKLAANILVVDDDISVRLFFEDFLTDKDLLGGKSYQVICTSDYESAMAKLASARVDLVFVDISLGDKSGLDILREIKNHGWHCPVIMITGAPAADTAIEALRLGAYDYLPKPVDIKSALRLTQRALDFKAVFDEKERYRSNLEAVFRSVKDAIITVDNELRLTGANAAATTLCGLILKNSLGVQFSQVKTKCPKNCSEVYQSAVLTGKNIKEYRVECCCQDNPQQVVVVTASPLRDQNNENIGAVIVKRDITSLVRIKQELLNRHQFSRIIGRSDKMLEIFNLMNSLVDLETTVLVTGESGTGKELVAEALHKQGNRASSPLIKVNCSALAENLLESELFGHVKGAFTGAIKDKIGRFQLAHGGTIFLDEIGDISPSLQLKLLRFLQEKEVERVGDTKTYKLDVRVIAATNCNLKELVKAGKFREDLYYRLRVVEIMLPPLRERREDIPLLVDYFCQKFNENFKKYIDGLAEEVLEKFMNYPWPGNVRELKHVLEYAFILCSGRRIEIIHLPPELRENNTPRVPLKFSPDTDKELEMILSSLEKAAWNKAKAARILGISRCTLHRKINKYKIYPPAE